ncbi:NFACT RNA binding domain-containing protein [Desulfovibrio psychrotolerans]|uniref:NFACT RNA-binding domain-containing protein n=1 Tax=Desulfovibrio psychrotolerans TaxID=415242 RepID=A0A7J0BPS5_9BACT|nr:NFACT RNA binding domain-containing protein [Desulfovibrio psychrotolerans]GFM35703.1 hypothetical protein DSM19430T_03870 [Desulfovibrio psychrotolerans]
MDAHFFRRLAQELAEALQGARVERFYAPAPDVTTIVLHGTGPKRHLLLRAGRRFPLLMLADERPANPDTPSAHAMWLRKYAGNRRLGKAVADWLQRRMAFPLSGEKGGWLVLDLRDGVTVLDALPDNFGQVPPWPPHEDFAAMLESKGDSKGDAGGDAGGDGGRDGDVWRRYPHYTPLLRETLACMAGLGKGAHKDVNPGGLEPDAYLEARALLADVEFGPGGCDTPVYCYVRPGRAAMLSTWPLHPAQYEGYGEREFATALEAALVAGEPELFGTMDRARQAQEDAPLRSALKRARKTLAKLDAEERRLQAMMAGHDDALALQAELWRIGTDARLEAVEVPFPDGGCRRIALDSLRTVHENMEHLFRQAARGRRGIGMLDARRGQLREQIARLEAGDAGAVPLPRSGKADNISGTRTGGKTVQGMRSGGKGQRKEVKGQRNDAGVHKLFQRFRSSDGLLMLRGRNAKGNHEILNRAQPHDLWFHAEDGPSAHLVLRLEFPGQEVPEQTLREAAVLVGLKSWQREGGQARVMCAFVRNVRKVKGAAVGAVHVARMERSLLVELAEEVERRLAPECPEAVDESLP